MTQSQDSLTDQLRALIPLANEVGLYDAADYLQRRVDEVDKRTGEIHERPPMGGRTRDFHPRYCHE